jgi:hypothetical protein
VQPRRDRQRLARRDRRRPFAERSSQLEREERVAARHLVNACQHGPRQPDRQRRSDELVDAADAQGTDLVPHAPVLVHGLHERVGASRLRPDADGREQSHRLVGKPSEGECECVRGDRVEPLSIVDRNHERPGTGQSAQRAEHGRSDEVAIRRRRRRVVEEEGRPQGPLLRRRQITEYVVESVAEEIADAGEGKLGIRFARACRRDAEAVHAAEADRLRPETRLPYSRLALEEQRTRSPSNGTEERVDVLQLGRAADEGAGAGRGRHQRLAASSVRERTPSFR